MDRDNQKPLDRWLSLAGLAVGIVLFLLAKTPAVIVILLLVAFLLLLHPVWNFWWIEQTLLRRVIALVVLVAGLVWLGRIAWPEPPKPPAPIPSPTPTLHPPRPTRTARPMLTPTIQDVISSFLKERTVVFVVPDRDPDTGAWTFAVESFGTKHAAGNLEIWARDNRVGVASSRRVVSGLTINPKPLSGMFYTGPERRFVYTPSDQNDQDLSFAMSDTNGSSEQHLRIVRDQDGKRERFASVVRDSKTLETLLGCRDPGVDLPTVQTLPTLNDCVGSAFLFSAANIAPERTIRFR